LRKGAGTLRNYKAAFKDLCAHCPNVVVSVSSVPLTSILHTAIAQNWKKLTHLTVVDGVIGDEFVSVGENYQSLLELSMGGMWAPQLQKFFLVCSPKLLSISTGAAQDVADYIAIASCCPLLHSLNGITDGMNDAALVALGSGCPLLCSLVLEYNQHVTHAGLAAFARYGALTTLWVERCEYLCDEGFCPVAQCSPLLEQVYITNCIVTDATLIAVGQHCHNLRQLEIDVIGAIYDGSAAIVAGCPLL
jgi:hypothetical protein